MRQLLAISVILILGAVAVACGGGGSTADTPDFSIPARVMDVDDFPFLVPDFSPIVFNDKLWIIGEERVAVKTDFAGGDIYLWSSTNATTWTQVANVDTFPFIATSDEVKVFIFNSKLWAFAESTTGDDGFWWTTDGVTWTAGPLVDDLDFYPFSDGLFAELNGRLLVTGEEKGALKVDNAAGDEYIWSTADMVTWEKGTAISDLPFDTEGNVTSFVYKNELYIYAYPKATVDKIDRTISDAMFYRTVNGIIWTMLSIALFSQERVSVSPGYVEFFLALGYMMFFGYYVPEEMKISGLTDEGEYIFYTKNFSAFTAGIATADFPFNNWEADWFAFDNKLWAIAPTKAGDANPGTFLWKIDL